MKNFYRDGGLVISIGALIIVLAVMSAYIYTTSTQVFWLIAPFIVLAAGFAIGKLIQVTRRTFQYFAHIDEEIDLAGRISLYSFPLSLAVIDKKRQFIWFNEGFHNEFGEIANYGNSIDGITELSIEKLLAATDGTEIRLKSNWYRVYATVPKEAEANNIYLVYFVNITEQKNLEIEKRLTHPVVMIVMIDSYEELFGGTLESDKAKITVQIDKLLEDYLSTTSGIMRKVSSDKFWIVTQERDVTALVESKIKLLDQARAIAVTDRISVTLSIGIGRNGRTLAESEDFARQALDMALGRGGDQAAIKTTSGFEFYGGVAKGVERQTKVRTRIITNSLMDLLQSSDRVYIMGHRFSDLDSIGSSVGLAAAIRNTGKNAYCVVDKLASLGGELIDRIKNDESGKGDFFITPQRAREDFSPDSLLIVVDTHNPNLLEDGELYAKAVKVVVIDHHRKMVSHIENAIISHHEPYASSASEMVTEMLQYFGPAGKISPLQAEALLSGIMLDTKNFAIKTGVRTFEAAAFLRKLGADTINVKSLFSNTMDNYKSKVSLVANARVYKGCAIASTEVVSTDMRVIAPQAADEMLGIQKVEASFVIYKTSGGEVYFSGRSLGGINVQLIMEALGGGGHQTMAGAQVRDISVKQGEEMLIGAIDSFFNTKNGK